VNPRLLTAKELGEAIGLKPATILDLWERGELPGFKYGRAVRFDLDEVLEAGRRPGLGGEAPTTPTRHPAGDVLSLMPTTPNRGEADE
jgi:excisionase family DNA binding protein